MVEDEPVPEPEPEPVPEPDPEPEPEVEPVAEKSGGSAGVVDFLGEPAPDVDETLADETVEPTPEEAKEKRQTKKAESIAATGGGYPDTPSGRALAEVGDLDGEDAESSEEAREKGLAYARAKRKYRWGY